MSSSPTSARVCVCFDCDFARCFSRVLNLHSQASPVTRAPSMPPVESSYIPPPPPLIQDYRHYYHSTSDLPGKRSLAAVTCCFTLIVAFSSACLGRIHPAQSHSKDTPRLQSKTFTDFLPLLTMTHWLRFRHV